MVKKTIIWGSTGCLLFAFGFLAGSFWTTQKFIKTFSVNDYQNTEAEPVFSSHAMQSHFYESIFWGGAFKPTKELEPLPRGDAKIKVRFSYDNNPTAGIGFSLALNGKYTSGMLVTGADGLAEVSLPFGQWHLNRLECQQWRDRPEGKFILVSGDEPGIGTKPFDELFFSFRDSGLTLPLSKASKPAHSQPIEIRKRINVLWPLPDEHKQKANVSRSAIRWEPYPKAASYLVKISHVTREKPRTTRFSPLIYKQVVGASFLPIAHLPNVESDLPPKEYAVKIRAYSQDGAFLSESEHSFSTFCLVDNRILVEFDGSEGEAFDQDDIERKFNAGKSLDAAEVLIDKSMYAEAERLLAQSDDLILPARTALLRGYLKASQGDCDKASIYFEESRSLGQKCIPKRYHMRCKANGQSNEDL